MNTPAEQGAHYAAQRQARRRLAWNIRTAQTVSMMRAASAREERDARHAAGYETRQAARAAEKSALAASLVNAADQ